MFGALETDQYWTYTDAFRRSESDLEDLFKGYGKITDLRLVSTFLFYILISPFA